MVSLVSSNKVKSISSCQSLIWGCISKDIIGLPRERQIDFTIDLLCGMTPFSISYATTRIVRLDDSIADFVGSRIYLAQYVTMCKICSLQLRILFIVWLVWLLAHRKLWLMWLPIGAVLFIVYCWSILEVVNITNLCIKGVVLVAGSYAFSVKQLSNIVTLCFNIESEVMSHY